MIDDRVQARFTRVVVVDHQRSFHDAVVDAVRSAFKDVDIRTATNLEEAFALDVSPSKGDLVLLDLELPGYNGLEALTRCCTRFPQAAIVVMSSSANPAKVNAAIGAGAAGYFVRTMSTEVLVAGLGLVAAGGIFVPREALLEAAYEVSRPVWTPAAHALTDRQIEVLRLLAAGRSNRDIGKELGISEGTVKQHLYGIYRVLGVTSRTAAIATATQHGLEQHYAARGRLLLPPSAHFPAQSRGAGGRTPQPPTVTLGKSGPSKPLSDAEKLRQFAGERDMTSPT